METLQTNSFPKLCDIIQRVCRNAGVSINKKTEQDLLFYFTELHKWNRVTNLTGIREPESLVLKHLGDTLLLLANVPEPVETVLDIGTGAGIPGLLMKLIRSDLYIVLAEAAKKKCSFLKFICASLNLTDIWIEEKRIAPDNPPKHLPSKGFDLIVSQAAGSVRWFVETGLDFSSSTGSMILLKGPSGEQELSRHQEFLKNKGLCHSIINAYLPVKGHRRLIIRLEKGQTSKT